MDYNKIRELLKKYWEGETSVEEERLLKDLLSQNNQLPKDLESEKKLFDYFKQERSVPALDEDLTERLKKQWKDETPIKKLFAGKQWMKYAAVLIPLIVLGYFLVSTNSNKQTDTFDDPEKAIAETEKALLLLSRNMNDGMSQMQTFRLFDEIKKSEKFKEQETTSTKN